MADEIGRFARRGERGGLGAEGSTRYTPAALRGIDRGDIAPRRQPERAQGALRDERGVGRAQQADSPGAADQPGAVLDSAVLP